MKSFRRQWLEELKSPELSILKSSFPLSLINQLFFWILTHSHSACDLNLPKFAVSTLKKLYHVPLRETDALFIILVSLISSGLPEKTYTVLAKTFERSEWAKHLTIMDHMWIAKTGYPL